MPSRRIPAVLFAVLSLLVSCSKKEAGPDIPGLVRALKDERGSVRGPAQIELTFAGEPAAGPVADLLRDPEPRIRLAAAQTLWSLGSKAKAAVPPLTTALEDTSPEVRANAAMALEAIGPASRPAVPALTARLRDSDWNVRQHAVKALGAIGPEAKEAVPALVRASKDDFTHSAATEALQKIQGPQ
jgi:HEAT repeat protein